MHKKSLYYVLAIIATVVTLTGCCGSANDYIEDESLLSSVSAEIINGELPPLKTQDGTSLTAEKDTFGKRAVVSIIVKAFTGEGSDYLDNADKIYELRGFLKSDNPSEKDIKITSIEKPVSVILKNNFFGNAETRYIGIRETGHSDWSFTNVDKFSNNNSSRAYLDGSDIVYQTNRLSIEIALFAKITNSKKLQPSTIVSDVNVRIKPEDENPEKPVVNQIKINNGCYDDNMKVLLVPTGNGVNNLDTSDFKAELTYMNNNGSNQLKVAGIDAVYEQPAKTSGTGDNYVHKVLIRNLNGTPDELNFVLKTKGVDVDEFPMDFNIVLKNSNILHQGALPFDYSSNVKVEEQKDPVDPKAPEIPANVRVLPYEIRYGNTVTITWDPEENIKYNVYLTKDSVENKVAENLSEGVWTSPEGAEALTIGSYSARIEAVNEFNLTSSAKPVTFKVVTAEGPAAPTINPLAKTGYLAGEPVTISWNAVQDPRQMPVTYNLWLYNSEPAETPTLSNLSVTEWTFNYLATGTYFITIAATNGEDVSERSAPASFAVVVPAVATLDTTRSTVLAGDYYGTSPEFIVKFSENNVDEETVMNAISVANVDAAKVHKEKQTDGFHITFTEPLPLNQTVTVSMSAMKDIYGYDVTPFSDFTFTTIPFEGLGTEGSPFILNEVAAVRATSDGKLPLIGSLTAEVGYFAGMTFANAAIVADSTLVNTAETAEWKNLGAVNVGNNAVVDIPHNRKWLADANGSVYMTFTGSLGGNTYHFKTAPKDINTEDGLTITLGDGSSETPYFVYTPQQLNEIRNHLDSAHTFNQMRNIDLADYTSAGTGWSSIGDDTNSFTGVYDGCGRTISNLRILDSSVYSYGLFYKINGASTVVKNLTFDSISIEGNLAGSIGAVTGYAEDGSAIENCQVLSAFIKANNSPNVGGIVGRMVGGHVANSSFDGQIITAGGYNGGIIGETTNNTEVMDCLSRGSLVKPTSQAGGIIGTMNGGGSIKRCRSEMEIHAAYAVGGLVGYVYGNSSFEDCEATGDCYSQTPVAAGLIGCVSGGDTGSFIRCHTSGKVIVTSGTNNGMGGLIGYLSYNNSATFEDCSSVSELIATGTAGSTGVGGLVGYFNCKGNLRRCYFKGDFDVANSDSVGGLLGFCSWNCSVNMEDCYAIFDSITCKNCAAGLIAHLYGGGTINRCFAEFNNIEGTTYAYESLLAGFIGGVNSDLNCSKCYAKFNKISSAGGRVGGFSGYTSCSGTISDCYALGNLVCSQSESNTIYDIGGFLGYNWAMEVNNCYTTAPVQVVAPASYYTGALIGENNDGQIYSSFTTASSGYEHIGPGNPATNCYTLTSGYDSTKDWGSYPWYSAVWNNLTDGALPTLKNMPVVAN